MTDILLTLDTFLHVLESPLERYEVSDEDARELFELTVRYFEEAGLLVDSNQLLLVAFAVSGHGEYKAEALTLAAVVAIRNRVRRLDIANGHRSIVDSMLSSGPDTAAGIAARLHGRLCPWPTDACQFLAVDGRHCAMTPASAGAILEALSEGGAASLRRVNNVEPYRYVLRL